MSIVIPFSSMTGEEQAAAKANGHDISGVIRLDQVEPRLVDWLWPGRLPLGKLVMLDGDPSVGKSTLVMDIAAKVSTGGTMPDRHRVAGAADVLLLSAEDGAEDTIRPRLDAAGGDPRRVRILDHVIELDDEGRERRRPPMLPRDVELIDGIVKRTGTKLVIVDVLTAYLGGADSHRDSDVRQVLLPLAAMASRRGCVVVALRHLTKGGGANPLYRGGGSIAFIGAARVGLIAGIDPEDDTRRILAVSKSNLAAIPDALAYRLENAEEHGCARVSWLGATAHRAADLLVSAEVDSDAADAAAALVLILEDGPLWVKDAIEAMAAAGFSKDQAKRAKAKAGVASVKVGKPGDAESGWRWELRRERQGSEGSGGALPLPSLPSEGEW